ncbi:MAG: hypothetical protein EPO32_09115 [Anaerolineae bacterium]|nr:MAG: hypothetical protein EPO32_09115 [Anaerolineae bacterium]
MNGRKKLFPVFLSLALVACAGPAAAPTATSPALAAATPAAPGTDTPAPTAEPELAARVNGEGLRLDVYAAHLAQFQAALVEFPDLLGPDETASGRVLADLTDHLLLAQAARAAGFSADAALVDQRLAALADNAGGQAALDAWAAANGYTAASLRADLAIQIESAWMRDQIAAGVPETAEQIEAHQLFSFDSFTVSRLYNQLENGTPFAQVRENNDPQNLGYLGWFPRGYLIFPALEEAVFSLQPGQYTAVLETEAGYHVIYVLNREPDRPLSPDARLTLQEIALAAWLAQARAQSQIEIYVP